MPVDLNKAMQPETRGELVIHLWSLGHTAEQIEERTHYGRRAIFEHLKKAREDGDQRAAHRTCQSPAKKRRTKIAILAQINLSPTQIAKMLNCTKRLVNMRLSEMQQDER